MRGEGAALQDDEIVANISVLVSVWCMFALGGGTYEKMTFLGRRFLEKGRRSGSCLDVQSSMMRYRNGILVKIAKRLLRRSRDVGRLCTTGGTGGDDGAVKRG